MSVKMCPNPECGADIFFEGKDVVDHPDHYNSHPSGIECIEIVEHMSFNIGNAMKYIWRADEKGAPIEDLKKAIWYLNREIRKRMKPLTISGEK